LKGGVQDTIGGLQDDLEDSFEEVDFEIQRPGRSLKREKTRERIAQSRERLKNLEPVGNYKRLREDMKRDINTDLDRVPHLPQNPFLYDDSVEISRHHSRHRSTHRKDYSVDGKDYSVDRESIYEKQDYYSRTRKDLRKPLDIRLPKDRKRSRTPGLGKYDPIVKRGFENMMERYKRTRDDMKKPIDTHIDTYSPVRSARSSTYDDEDGSFYGRRQPGRKRPFGNVEVFGLRRKMRQLSQESDVTEDDYKRHEPSNSRVRKSRAIQTILQRVESLRSERNDPMQPDMKQSIADQLKHFYISKRPFPPWLSSSIK
jgi:hypothetical protein